MEIKELENRFDVFCVDNNLDNSFLKKDRGIGWLSESNDNEISYRKLKNKLLLSNMREITQVLTRANVQFVFLKGLIEAYDLYPEFYFRPCEGPWYGSNASFFRRLAHIHHGIRRSCVGSGQSGKGD